MIQYRTPTPQFTTLISNNIRHWQETAVQSDRTDYLHAEQQNVYQSIDMGLQVAATMPTATDLLLTLHLFIQQHGYWRVWIPLMEKSIAAQADTTKRWELQIQLAYFLWKSGEYKTAVSLLNELLTKPTSITQRGRIHRHLGNSYLNLRQYRKAQHQAHKSLTIFEHYPESITNGIAPALNLIGMIRLSTGKNDAAIPLFREAKQLWMQNEHYDDVLSALLNEGLAHSNMGQQDDALRCCQEAVPLLERFDSLLYTCQLHLNLGTIYGRQEKWRKAEATFLHVDRAALYQQGHLSHYARIVTSLGLAAMRLGKIETAVSHTTEAITIWQQLGDELMEANALENLGDIHHQSGNIPSARTSYQNGIDLTHNHPNDLLTQQLRHTLQSKVAHLSKETNGRAMADAI